MLKRTPLSLKFHTLLALFVLPALSFSATIQVSATKAGAQKSIKKAVALAKPGDVIVVEAGTYKDQVDIKVSGTKDKPITLKAEGKVIIDRTGAGGKGIVGRDVGHWLIDGFTIVGASQGIKFKNPFGITMKNINASKCTSGFSLEGSSAKDIRYESCVAEKNIGGGFEVANGVVAENLSYVKCRASFNNCKDGADGFGISHKSVTKNVRFEYCIADNNGSDGFDLSGRSGHSVFVIGCLAHHNGTKMWGANFKCWNPGSVFINCVAYKTGATADANFASHANDVSFYNCTSGENADAGFAIVGKNTKIINCIIAHSRKVSIRLKEAGVNVLVKNTLVHSNGSDTVIKVGEDGNVKADPKFTDYESGDYSIAEGSEAKGKGQQLKEVAIDFNQKKRSKSKPSVGAFEL